MELLKLIGIRMKSFWNEFVVLNNAKIDLKREFLGQAWAHPAKPIQIKESVPRGTNEFRQIVETQNLSNFQEQCKNFLIVTLMK